MSEDNQVVAIKRRYSLRSNGNGEVKSNDRFRENTKKKLASKSSVDSDTSESDSDTFSTVNTSSTVKTSAYSGRIIKQKRFDPAPLTDEQILKNFITRKGLLRRLSYKEQLSKFQPTLLLDKLTPQDIAIHNNEWKIIDRIKNVKSLTFKATILARLFSEDGKKFAHVKWNPSGFFDDEWVDEDDFSKDGIKMVEVQNLTWKQKLQLQKNLVAQL